MVACGMLMCFRGIARKSRNIIIRPFPYSYHIDTLLTGKLSCGMKELSDALVANAINKSLKEPNGTLLVAYCAWLCSLNVTLLWALIH